MRYKNIIKHNISLILLLSLLSYFNAYAINTSDKIGRPIEDIIEPTSEYKSQEDLISDAVRKTINATNVGGYKDPTKNIYSEAVIESSNVPAYDDYIKSLYDAKMIKTIEDYGEITDIRYTVSITNVDEDRYILIDDTTKDRLKMKVIVDNVGEFFAKDGFFKVNGKTFYFDENGNMVLGPARDNKGNYYFFSYDTGELIE